MGTLAKNQGRGDNEEGKDKEDRSTEEVTGHERVAHYCYFKVISHILHITQYQFTHTTPRQTHRQLES